MTEGLVFFNKRLAGRLYREFGEYVFVYDDGYYADPLSKSISFTLSKIRKEYRSKKLFIGMNFARLWTGAGGMFIQRSTSTGAPRLISIINTAYTSTPCRKRCSACFLMCSI